MRYASTLLAVTLAVVTQAAALSGQEAARQGTILSLGVQAGLNVADQAGADVFAPHDRFGFAGGLYFRADAGGRTAFQIGLLYTMKGGEENTEQTPGKSPDQFWLSYLEIPLLARLQLITGGPRPAIFAGPALSFELGCRFEDFPDGVSRERDCVDAGILTRSVDVGVVFGLGLDIPVTKGSLTVDARGVVGLSSLDDSPADLDYYNRTLSLMLGYRHPL